MANSKEALYALVGAGDLAIEKARALRDLAARDAAGDAYSDFVSRGRDLSQRIRVSAPTKHAVTQTKVARSQIKAAATSVRKAARLDARAARSAATKVAKAS